MGLWPSTVNHFIICLNIWSPRTCGFCKDQIKCYFFGMHIYMIVLVLLWVSESVVYIRVTCSSSLLFFLYPNPNHNPHLVFVEYCKLNYIQDLTIHTTSISTTYATRPPSSRARIPKQPFNLCHCVHLHLYYSCLSIVCSHGDNVILLSYKLNHVTPPFYTLQWLPIWLKINSKTIWSYARYFYKLSAIILPLTSYKSFWRSKLLLAYNNWAKQMKSEYSSINLRRNIYIFDKQWGQIL